MLNERSQFGMPHSHRKRADHESALFQKRARRQIHAPRREPRVGRRTPHKCHNGGAFNIVWPATSHTSSCVGLYMWQCGNRRLKGQRRRRRWPFSAAVVASLGLSPLPPFVMAAATRRRRRRTSICHHRGGGLRRYSLIPVIFFVFRRF